MRTLVAAVLVLLAMGTVPAAVSAQELPLLGDESALGPVIFGDRLADKFESQYHTVFGNIMTNMHGNADVIMDR